MPQRLPTGITEIDRSIRKGFITGSIISLVAPPDSQSEVLLEEFANERRTLYLSTTRRVDAVKRAFNHHGREPEASEMVFRHMFDDDPTLFGDIDKDHPLDRIEHAIQTVCDSPRESNIIIDTMNVIESMADQARLIEFFNSVDEILADSESLCFLHCIGESSNSDMRNLTLNMSDAVMQVNQNRRGEEIETRLSIPKIRGCSAVSETIKLQLTDSVEVDTSRDIA